MTEKLRHFGAKINEAGQVSALCYDPPRPIRLAVATWVMREDAVTCSHCKRLLVARRSGEREAQSG